MEITIYGSLSREGWFGCAKTSPATEEVGDEVWGRSSVDRNSLRTLWQAETVRLSCGSRNLHDPRKKEEENGKEEGAKETRLSMWLSSSHPLQNDTEDMLSYTTVIFTRKGTDAVRCGRARKCPGENKPWSLRSLILTSHTHPSLYEPPKKLAKQPPNFFHLEISFNCSLFSFQTKKIINQLEKKKTVLQTSDFYFVI